MVTQKNLTSVGGPGRRLNGLASNGVLGSAAKGFGYLFGVLMILTFVGSASVWTLGSARVQAVAALDGAAPRMLGKFGKQGTPVTMCIVMGIVGSIFTFITFLVTSGSLNQFFVVMIALDTSLTIVVYVFVIPAIVKLRYSHANVHRPYIIPGGKAGLWICAIITEVLCIVTCFTLLWPGLIDNMLGQKLLDHRQLGHVPSQVRAVHARLVHRLAADRRGLLGRRSRPGGRDRGRRAHRRRRRRGLVCV